MIHLGFSSDAMFQYWGRWRVHTKATFTACYKCATNTIEGKALYILKWMKTHIHFSQVSYIISIMLACLNINENKMLCIQHSRYWPAAIKVWDYFHYIGAEDLLQRSTHWHTMCLIFIVGLPWRKCSTMGLVF